MTTGEMACRAVLADTVRERDEARAIARRLANELRFARGTGISWTSLRDVLAAFDALAWAQEPA